MKTIATYGDTIGANLAKGVLEDAGIAVYLADEQTVGLAWHLAIAVGGIKLQVADENAVEAARLLAEESVYEGEPGDSADEAGEASVDAAVDSVDDSVAESVASPAIGGVEPEDDELSDRELNAQRSIRGALLGILLFPLQIYIFWLLIKVFLSDLPLRRRYQMKAILAALINIPYVLFMGWYVKDLLIRGLGL